MNVCMRVELYGCVWLGKNLRRDRMPHMETPKAWELKTGPQLRKGWSRSPLE